MQMANCFELATLLVSFLIGCGYNAFVVQGYATETVCNNDLRIVKLDLQNIIKVCTFYLSLKCLIRITRCKFVIYRLRTDNGPNQNKLTLQMMSMMM